MDTLTAENKNSTSRRAVLLAGGVIAAAALAAYGNSFRGPLVFDDLGTIAGNRTIRHLWPMWSALRPPDEGMPVTGRPIANLSLALNYALGGANVAGYHAANLLIHILAGLTLFGIVRRTLSGMGFQPMLKNEHGLEAHGTSIGFAAALLWTLHPLQTESVTYISQRAESLMGLFYLLTSYCFIRSVDAASRRVPGDTRRDAASTFKSPSCWACFSVAACLFGMATKEVMATAPVMVLLYDRTFVSGSLRQAWRLRWRYYLGSASTWLLLAALLAGAGSRGGTAGFGAEISWPVYALTQFRAVAHYLRLSVWPHPLVFFYGSTIGAPAGEMAGDVLVVAGLAAATGWLLFRNSAKGPGVDGAQAPLRFAERSHGGSVVAPPCRDKQALGFAGAWFFLILAPSSSVVPVATETIAEHRMYLSLAAVIVVGVVLAVHLGGRALRSSALRSGAGWAVLALAAVACGCLTARRNEDYRSGLVLWRATVDKFPGNEVAQYNLAMMLASAGKTTEAIGHYREAVRLKPDYTEAHNNLGETLAGEGRWAEAVTQYEAASARDPEFAMIHANRGDALLHLGRLDEAIASYLESVRLEPDNPGGYYQLGAALARAGRVPDAVAADEAALRLRPNFPQALNNLADALTRASRLQPDNPGVHNDLGCALAQLGRTAEARDQFEEALRLKPDDPAARANLARLSAGQ